ncbi:DHHW family protein [Anaerocolumna sp. AGMB13020]|uniref:DHHW family protein n=1 Tax=Anaerocolumna sp. AGMB13020 TaxID=3081750 RepID=UPI002953E31B|nr:DHHW family protein [Anaerocolumna sp. AGMB13020]WOO38087.1 DHHW family protein [Anaerocolumna sp. AGMB13020]
MKDRIKYVIGISSLLIALFTLSIINCLKPQAEFSDSERRKLKLKSDWSAELLLSNKMGDAFEGYAMDQFPFRDIFRRIKAYTLYKLLQEKDNNGIYIADGYAEKLNYPLKEASLSNALNRFQFLYDNYLAEGMGNLYTCIVPDKGYYLAEKFGYPHMDYDRLYDTIRAGMRYADFIDIRNLLHVKSYYKTDTHWRQEMLKPVAKKLLNSMGAEDIQGHSYQEITPETLFYGVYYGQSALPLEKEYITYLTNELLDSCIVYNYEKDSTSGIYDFDKLKSRDPYEMFLSGSVPLLTIENPKALGKKELIIFRDSFGSSLTPLLAEGYSKITLVDIRYVSSAILGDYIDFNGQDVLFLYSTLLLNDSFSMK